MKIVIFSDKKTYFIWIIASFFIILHCKFGIVRLCLVHYRRYKEDCSLKRRLANGNSQSMNSKDKKDQYR